MYCSKFQALRKSTASQSAIIILKKTLNDQRVKCEMTNESNSQSAVHTPQTKQLQSTAARYPPPPHHLSNNYRRIYYLIISEIFTGIPY